MGWHIDLEVNTVRFKMNCADALFAIGEPNELWYEVDDVLEQCSDDPEYGILTFNYDHMEHMDYMWRAEIQKFCLEQEVDGLVGFSSSDGDNRGSRWGYRFTNGVMVEVTGEINYT